ncbi:hypothetical protein OQI_33745 [Streptomyces pharetrae CZA14]|uniref:Uncharacterized protein n=1 Tax=Streptomyces pharetrae CZA14 TaxID=1144883 RepID=A0ABX3Y8W3_9ACTN|nr:hypothetical protein OQI_33745 [Streptomyces pharetrae CZA14]
MRRGRGARRGKRSASMPTRCPAGLFPVVVLEHTMRTTADGVRTACGHPQDGHREGGPLGADP